MLKKEWKSLFQNKILLLVVIAVIMIPVHLCRTVPEIHVGSIWGGKPSSGGCSK